LLQDKYLTWRRREWHFTYALLHITEADIAEANQELRGKFPKKEYLMASVVADTHALNWYILQPEKLSLRAFDEAISVTGNSMQCYMAL